MILVDDVFKYLLFVTFKFWLAIFLRQLICISSIWASPRSGSKLQSIPTLVSVLSNEQMRVYSSPTSKDPIDKPSVILAK